MKGFKPFGKPVSFPTSADSSFKGGTPIAQKLVRPHFRAAPVAKVKTPHFAKGGPVSKPNLAGDAGNSAVIRKEPTTTLDAQHSGKGPLIPGYKKGGKVNC